MTSWGPARPDRAASRSAARRHTWAAVAAGLQELAGELPHHLQRREPVGAVGTGPHQPLVDQRLDGLRAVDVGRRRGHDLFQRVQGGPAGEDGEGGERAAGRLVEQVVAPQQGAAQGLLAARQVAGPAAQQPELGAEAVGDLGGAERADAGGGQLHREGQSPDAVDDAGDGVLLRRAEPQIGADRTGPFHELRHGGVPG